jgi:hypothetical protein
MAIETHTGRLVIGEAQVAMEDGTVLAVPGPNPCATAVARFTKWGETQPVTVTGTTGIVDNGPVLFVTSIQWAAQASVVSTAEDFSTGSVMSLDDAPPPAPVPPPVSRKTIVATKTKKSATAKSARSRSKR